MKNIFVVIGLFFVFISCSQHTIDTNVVSDSVEKQEVIEEKVVKLNKPYSSYTNQDWREVLSDDQYWILREKGTERPFTGKLLANKEEGLYKCAGCDNPLFKSEMKFKSGTGWPSFYDEIKDSVLEMPDNSHGMTRIEIVCSRCKGHLGHVFQDGPNPTGLRYCVNSLSLTFESKN